MDLREYLFRKRMTVRRFAILINYNPNYISGIISQKIKPGKKFIKAVKEVTKGEVTFEETENENDSK